VLRAGCNIALSLLMVITLLWGGCIACEQFFMFPGISSKCCNKSGQCERPGKSQPKTECNRMPLALQGGSHVDVAPPPVAGAMTAAASQPVVPLRLAVSEIVPEPSPPDLQVLYATFLL
jgi:hypothetical protein